MQGEQYACLDRSACLAHIARRCRWIERHNAKLREGGKKDEKKRLKQFVEDAYRKDPRVVARREFEKSERYILDHPEPRRMNALTSWTSSMLRSRKSIPSSEPND